jgi:hypothetical protein
MRTVIYSTILFTFANYAAMAAPATWEQLCGNNGSKQKSSALPAPVYTHPLIAKVAEKFSAIESIELQARQQDGKTEQDKAGSYVKSMAFSPYNDFEETYGLCSGKKKYQNKCAPEQKGPKNVGINTHNMLTILCGEYRDNLSMLNKKLEWLSNAVITPNAKQTYSKSKNVFDQLTGDGYKQMVKLSLALYQFRANEMGASAEAALEIEQESIQPMTICEYRYILSQYIVAGKEIRTSSEFNTYNNGLKTFMASAGNCSASDKDYYYEFRGDGNFKAQTLESNGQLWFSRAFSSNCTAERKVGANTGRGAITIADCDNYFKSPSKTRGEINQAAMLKMFFYPNKADGLDIHDIMKRYNSADPSGLVIVTEDINGDGLGELVVLDRKVMATCGSNITKTSPGACQLVAARTKLANIGSVSWAEMGAAEELLYTIIVTAGENKIKDNKNYAKALENAKKKATSLFGSNKNYLKGVHLITEAHEGWSKSYMSRKDRGFTSIFTDKEEAWDRMAIVLDRHTEWYSIDTLHLKNGYFKPTFSPWIASSYYIYNSHSFVIPGYAMNTDLDPGRMHWMYVQKVKKNKWYKASDMNKTWPVPAASFDLLNLWFDETTFSRSELGATENGWDRFGGVDESEYESILWLYQTPRFNIAH